MSSSKLAYISYEAFRVSKLLSGLVSCKMLTAIRFGASASVYNAEMTVSELTTAQSIILALYYGLLTSDMKFCYFLQGLISNLEQLKSPYLSLWLRDDFKFNTLDVYKVISNLAHLVRGQHIALPDYVLRVFIGLNSKYGIIDICKTNKDLEAFYFLSSVNVPCSRSQQTDKISATDIEEKCPVGPLKSCPHMSAVVPVPNGFLDLLSRCSTCDVPFENWVCLTCYTVGCSRYVNKHMMKHNESTNHPLMLSLSHLSVWCYPCDRYIDNQYFQWPSGVRTKYSLPTNFIRCSADSNSFNGHHKLITEDYQHGQPLNCLIKEPNNDSDDGPDSFQRNHSSSLSKQSLSSERSPNSDSRKPEFNSRNVARSRNKSRTRGPQPKEGKPLAHAISTPNISQLSLKDDETSPEAGLVQSYLSRPGTTPVPYSQLRHLVCKRDGKGGKSPLHQASKDGLFAVVKALIKYGAPVNCRDDVGFTPAHYAARGGYIEVLEILKQHKADLSAVGDTGETLLHLAARKNRAGTCGWLLDNGVAIDAQGYKGRTALHCAAMWGLLDTVHLLLLRKASVHIKDFYHNTAYDLAVSQGHPKVANMLKNMS